MTDDPEDSYSKRELEEAREAGARHQRQKQAEHDIDDLEERVREHERTFLKGVYIALAGFFGAAGAALVDWVRDHMK